MFLLLLDGRANFFAGSKQFAATNFRVSVALEDEHAGPFAAQLEDAYRACCGPSAQLSGPRRVRLCPRSAAAESTIGAHAGAGVADLCSLALRCRPAPLESSLLHYCCRRLYAGWLRLLYHALLCHDSNSNRSVEPVGLSVLFPTH